MYKAFPHFLFYRVLFLSFCRCGRKIYYFISYKKLNVKNNTAGTYQMLELDTMLSMCLVMTEYILMSNLIISQFRVHYFSFWEKKWCLWQILNEIPSIVSSKIFIGIYFTFLWVKHFQRPFIYHINWVKSYIPEEYPKWSVSITIIILTLLEIPSVSGENWQFLTMEVIFH